MSARGPAIPWTQDGSALRGGLDGRTTTADRVVPGRGRRAKVMSCPTSFRIVLLARHLGPEGLEASERGPVRQTVRRNER